MFFCVCVSSVCMQRVTHHSHPGSHPPVSIASLSRREDWVLEGMMGQKTDRDIRAMSWSCGMWCSQMSQEHLACRQGGEGGQEGVAGEGSWAASGCVQEGGRA